LKVRRAVWVERLRRCEQREEAAEVLGAGPAGGEVGGDARVMLGRIAVVELAVGVEMQQRERVLAADVGRVGVEEPLDVGCAAHWYAV
jgi:hypothetical protein